MSEEAERSARDPDRDAEHFEKIERVMQQIVTEANMEGWGSLEVLDLMEKILKKLQLTYAAEDTPHSALIEGELEPSGDLPLEE